MSKKINFDITPQGPYFSVLRSALWGTPVDTSAWPQTVDWQPILDNYKAQCLLPLAGDALFRLPEQYQLSQPQKDEIMSITALYVRMHYKIRTVYRKISDILETQHVYPILLKGEELADLYPKPNLRACGDIDFYVGPMQSAYVRDLLLSDGATFYSEEFAHHTLMYDDIMLEIHHQFGKIVLSNSLTKKINTLLIREIALQWPESATLSSGILVRKLPPYTELLYNFCHTVGHIIEGIGIRQFIDLTILLHNLQGKYNIDQLYQDLRYLGLLRCWQKYTGYMVDYLGLPSQDCPFYKPLNSETIISELIDHGNFGFHRSNKDCFQRDGLIRGFMNHLESTKLLRAMLPVMAMKKTYHLIITHLTGNYEKLNDL